MKLRVFLIASYVVCLSISYAAVGMYRAGEGSEEIKCSLCRVTVEAIKEVTFVLEDDVVKHYCSINCAVKTYNELKNKIKYIAVTDETTGEKVDCNLTFFVESEIVTDKSTGTNIHVFKDGDAAKENAKKYNGKVIDCPFPGWRSR